MSRVSARGPSAKSGIVSTGKKCGSGIEPTRGARGGCSPLDLVPPVLVRKRERWTWCMSTGSECDASATLLGLRVPGELRWLPLPPMRIGRVEFIGRVTRDVGGWVNKWVSG